MLYFHFAELNFFPTVPSVQWINTTATRSGVRFNYPISMTLYAQTITHNGSTPGATGIENQTAYDDWNTTQAAPVWIIAIGK